jgi:hypothetical protein
LDSNTYYTDFGFTHGEDTRAIQANRFVLDRIHTETGTFSIEIAHQKHLDTLWKRTIKAWTDTNHQDTDVNPVDSLRPLSALDLHQN